MKDSPGFVNSEMISAINEALVNQMPIDSKNNIDVILDDGSGGSGGSGTIMNQDDWLRIAADRSEDRNGKSATYVLGADITIDFDRRRGALIDSYGHFAGFKDYEYDGIHDDSWFSDFSGTVKGNGHKIYIKGTHMIIDGTTGGSTLFANAVGATFEDVTFVGSGIYRAENCTFKNCLSVNYPLTDKAISCTFESCGGTVSVTTMPDKFMMGALVCEAKECSFRGCKIDGVVKGENDTGGLVGEANGCSFTDCLVKASVSGGGNVGGLVGWAENCEFMNSAARGVVTGNDRIGGFVGYSKNSLYTTCQAKGNVTGGDLVGGFVGDLRGGSVSKCSATGKVTCNAALFGAPGDIGGFAGQIIDGAAVEDSVATGAVAASGASNVGGFAGDIGDDSFVQRCYASGAVVGGGFVGGFAGTMTSCRAYNCYATGSVSAKGYTTGAGATKSTSAYAGGFAAIADSKGGVDCRYCYACGKVTTIKANLAKMVLAYSGGLTPLPLTAAQAKMMPASVLKTMMSDCVACYWNTSTTGQKYSGMGSGKSTAAMKKKSTFSGWNAAIWNFSAGYPYLSALGKTGAIPLVGEADPAPPSTKPKLTVAAVGDKSGCKVTGGGSYKNGTKVTLKATASKTAMFDGWFADEECTQKISSKATYTFTTGAEASGVYAKFTAKKTKLAETTFNCFDSYSLVAGKKCSIKLGVTSPLSTKLTVSGLPKGLSFKNGVVSGTPAKPGNSKVKLTAKNSAGTKTKTVVFSVVNPGFDMAVAGFFAGAGGEATAIAAGETVEIPVGVSQTIKVSSIPGLEGVSKSGATVKVSGLPTGMKYSGGNITGVPTKKGEKKTVKIAFSNKWGWSSSFSFKMNVVALPAWVTDTFIGGNTDCSASVTISAVGKTSGKVLFAGDTWTLAASSLSADAATGGYRIKVTRTDAKKKKATIYLSLAQLEDGRGHVEAEDGTFWAESSIWKSSDEWKAAAEALTGKTCQLEDATLGTLTVTMKAGGMVMVSDGYRSATTTLIPLDVSAAPAVDPGTGAISPFEAEMHILLPARAKAPKKAAAFRRMHIAWDGEGWSLKWGELPEPVTTCSFAFKEADLHRLEADDTTTRISVPLLRNRSGETSSNMIKVLAPSGSIVQTVSVDWGVDETQKAILVDVAQIGFAEVGEAASVVLLSEAGEEIGVRHIVYMDSAVSSANPLWIGERTADTLGWGEWTMDLDVAKAKVAASEGDAYTLVSVEGALWCPDCANTQRNFFDVSDANGNRLARWAMDHHVALVKIDIPNFSRDDGLWASPTYLSPEPFSSRLARPSSYLYDGADAYLTNTLMRSGLGYLTRKGVPDEEAQAVFERNRLLVSLDMSEGGFHPSNYANPNRTPVPYFLLLKKDGTFAAEFRDFATRAPGVDANWDELIANFDAMLMAAGD